MSVWPVKPASLEPRTRCVDTPASCIRCRVHPAAFRFDLYRSRSCSYNLRALATALAPIHAAASDNADVIAKQPDAPIV
jgi:hypothetical protein